jgi:hypothetical protein
MKYVCLIYFDVSAFAQGVRCTRGKPGRLRMVESAPGWGGAAVYTG